MNSNLLFKREEKYDSLWEPFESCIVVLPLPPLWALSCIEMFIWHFQLSRDGPGQSSIVWPPGAPGGQCSPLPLSQHRFERLLWVHTDTHRNECRVSRVTQSSRRFGPVFNHWQKLSLSNMIPLTYLKTISVQKDVTQIWVVSCVRGFCLEFPDVPTLNIAQVMILRRPNTGQGPTSDDS